MNGVNADKMKEMVKLKNVFPECLVIETPTFIPGQ